MGDLLDWWRVYVAVLGALLGALVLLSVTGASRLAAFAAVALVAAGLVAGLLWQSARSRPS